MTSCDPNLQCCPVYCWSFHACCQRPHPQQYPCSGELHLLLLLLLLLLQTHLLLLQMLLVLLLLLLPLLLVVVWVQGVCASPTASLLLGSESGAVCLCLVQPAAEVMRGTGILVYVLCQILVHVLGAYLPTPISCLIIPCML